jgi:hypothetical protein
MFLSTASISGAAAIRRAVVSFSMPVAMTVELSGSVDGKSALIRCRALVGRIESALCNEKPEHFLDELTLADFYASLERATDILGQKRRQPVDVG